ncbi:MBL fold metallo-hydrolase [Candidatus Woesearchaeota archaeon]|nr:MBL fold metallo-hydrolase [Candidatus Woesearchaeota archaeon]
MHDKLVFLGTGGDPTVVGKQRRASGGIVLRTAGYQFHMDPGPGALCKAKEYNINIRENTCVMVSHAHLHHANDINAVISAMTYNGLDKKGVMISSASVVNGTDELNPVLMPHYRGCMERVIVVHEGQKVGVGEVEIDALLTNHNDPTAIGFRFVTSKFTLVYSSDTAYNVEVANQYKGADVLILNVVHASGVSGKDNLSIDEAEKVIERAKPQLCIITHFGNKLIESDPIYQARELQKKTGVQVMAATDGLEIDPKAYAKSNRQQKLSF